MSSYYDAGYISEDITNDFLTPVEGIKGKEAVKAYVKWIASMRNITLAIRDSKPHKIREYDTDQDLWRIDVLTGTHNHPFPEFAEGSRLGTLTPNQFKEIQQQERLRISPCNMLADIKRRDPTNVTDIKRVNNAINNIRSQKREGRTPTQNYFHLLQKFDYRYEFRMVDGSNELQDVIFSHPESYAMVNTYPQVLIIDNTYKTTVYDMPLLEAVGATSTNKTFTIAYAFMQRETQEHFEFVLQFIRGLYESVEPNVVLTDRDLALMKAVDKIFPNSQKQLCRRHIEQCVLTRALQQPGFNKEFAECFKHRWNKAIEAATPEEFLHSWEWVKQQYKHYPGLIHYCEETWLSQHIDRVLSAFIDQRLHYGNYTTNRVEQEHHRVKANLDGSNHTFDYVFEQIHQVMELQIVEIKKQSMINVNKTRTDMLNCKLFSNLVRNVTFKAFELIIAEGTRDLGQNTCGCYLWRTHGLPCNCRLLQYMSCGWSIPLDSIDLYWRTLNIEFSCGTTTRRKIFQDTEDISAPPAVEKHKKPTSTDREPSNWEKWCKVVGLKSSKKPKGKGRVAATNAYQDIPPETRHRNSISEGCWTSFPEGSQHRASFSHGPRPPSPDSPPSMPSNSQQVPPRNSMARQSESRVPLRGSKMEQYFPPYIREYIESYTDVVGDGNCGFRVIALAVLGTQDQWRTVREDMLRDLRGRSELYNNVIGGFTTMPALDQIINHFDGPCGPTNYFSVPYCGYVAATTYNVFVMTFGETGGYLCPPVALEPYRELPSVRVVLGHVNNYNHWILLHMRSDYHPVPWLLEYWIKRRDPSAYGLELQFKEQMELYNYLHNNDAKRRQDKREAEKEAKKQARQNQFLFFL